MDRLHRYGETTSSPMSSVLLTFRDDQLGNPPPSIIISLPSGKASSSPSPCPTSIAASSDLPLSPLGGNRCRNPSANSPSTAASAGHRHSRDFRTVNVSRSSEAKNDMESHTEGSGTRKTGSHPPCE